MTNQVDSVAAQLDKMCEEFLDIYDEYKEVELEMERLKQMMGVKKDELISIYNSLGITSKDINGVKITKQTRTHPKVTNFDKLEDFIKNVLDEPLSEYQEVKFDPRALRELIAEAQEQSLKQGKPVSELMPDGLDISVTTYLQVRQNKSSVKNGSQDDAPDYSDDDTPF